MTSHSDIAVNGATLGKKIYGVKSIIKNGVECVVLGQQKLGSLVGKNDMDNSHVLSSNTIMYEDSIIQWFNGLTKIRADKPSKQYVRCNKSPHIVRCNCKNYKCNHNKKGCGVIERRPRKQNHKAHNRILGTIPYATKQPRYSIVEQILYIQKDKGLRWRD